MTDNERVLHTVLSTCLRKIPEAQGDKIGVLQAKVAFFENRLEEIGKIISDQIMINVKRDITKSIAHHKR